MQNSTSGTIGIVAAESGRYTRFYQMLDQLERPEGTKVIFGFGPNIIRNRNEILKKAIGDWVLFIDDDQVFFPNTLMKLLAHDKPITVPLILRRRFPYEPVVYTYKDGQHIPMLTKGLKKVDAAGTGMMLLKREAFEKIGEFRYGAPHTLAEDLDYCKRAGDLGIDIYCDFNLPVGHLTPFAIWPTSDGKVALKNSGKTYVVDRT